MTCFWIDCLTGSSTNRASPSTSSKSFASSSTTWRISALPCGCTHWLTTPFLKVKSHKLLKKYTSGSISNFNFTLIWYENQLWTKFYKWKNCFFAWCFLLREKQIWDCFQTSFTEQWNFALAQAWAGTWCTPFSKFSTRTATVSWATGNSLPSWRTDSTEASRWVFYVQGFVFCIEVLYVFSVVRQERGLGGVQRMRQARDEIGAVTF